jgi:hypothetical protein
MGIVSQVKRVLADPLVLAELFAVSNIAFLAGDIYLAHSLNGFAHWAEWIPFGFSLAAPVLLVLAMALGGSLRPPMRASFPQFSIGKRLSRAIGIAVGLLAIVIGVAGLLFHLESQFFAEQTLRNLVYTAPFAAPLAYSGLGLLLLLNRMVPEDTVEWSRWVVLLALGGWIGNFVLSLADHAQNAFFYWAEWIPVVASAAAIGALSVAAVEHRNRPFLLVCLGLMIAEIVVAVAGWLLHVRAIVHSPMQDNWERIVYSAPLFAPLLFADLALLACIGLATLYVQSGQQEPIGDAAASSS